MTPPISKGMLNICEESRDELAVLLSSPVLVQKHNSSWFSCLLPNESSEGNPSIYLFYQPTHRSWKLHWMWVSFQTKSLLLFPGWGTSSVNSSSLLIRDNEDDDDCGYHIIIIQMNGAEFEIRVGITIYLSKLWVLCLCSLVSVCVPVCLSVTLPISDNNNINNNNNIGGWMELMARCQSIVNISGQRDDDDPLEAAAVSQLLCDKTTC